MKQTVLQFVSVQDLQDYLQYIQPVLYEVEGTNITGLFSNQEIELAVKGFDANVEETVLKQ